MVLLADGKTLMIATRIDGGDGGPPYCPVMHTPKNYHSVFSTDGGLTWSQPRVMRDTNGRWVHGIVEYLRVHGILYPLFPAESD